MTTIKSIIRRSSELSLTEASHTLLVFFHLATSSAGAPETELRDKEKMQAA
jgi:hypothetical protein